MIRLQDIDINLLLVFQLLYEERKTTTAAERLGVNQSSVSHALRRLRGIFDDPLFERTARGLQPTPLGGRIGESMGYALSTLQDSINVSDTFAPATSERTFTLSMTDIGEIHFLPQVIPRLAEIAPGIKLSTVRDRAINLTEQMETGHVDLALGLLPQLGAAFFQRRLFSQKYVCLMREDHPLARGEFDLDAFARARHAVVVAQGTGHGRVEELLARSGIPRVVRLRLPHFVAVPYIVSESDLVVTVTEKLAERTAKRFGLVIRPHPVDLPEIQINIFWHRRFHHDAGNKWLRRLIFEMFGEGAGQSQPRRPPA